MSTVKALAKQRNRRNLRVRSRVKRSNSSLSPRVSVHRTLKQIYAQIIDDNTHRTLVSYSSLVLDGATGDKEAIAKQVGIELGKRAAQKSITDVVFDRGRFMYGGRLAALADGMRESGLKF